MPVVDCIYSTLVIILQNNIIFVLLKYLRPRWGGREGAALRLHFSLARIFLFSFLADFFFFLAELEAGGSSELVSYLSNCINQSDHDFDDHQHDYHYHERCNYDCHSYHHHHHRDSHNSRDIYSHQHDDAPTLSSSRLPPAPPSSFAK